MQEMQVQSPGGQEDPLEKEIVTYSSILVWETPAVEKLGGLQSMGSQSVGHNLATKQYAQVLKFIQQNFIRTYYSLFTVTGDS